MTDTKRLLPITLGLLLIVGAVAIACSAPSVFHSLTPRSTPTPWPAGIINDPDIRTVRDLYPALTMTPLPSEIRIWSDLRDRAPMIRVPGGPFLMGSTPDQSYMISAIDEVRCNQPRNTPSLCISLAMWAEVPQRTVELPEYYIDQYEVTNAQYRLCVWAGVCPDIPEGAADYVIQSKWRLHDVTYSRYPVNVPWAGAEAYCQWVGKRLPAEAEWEKAARGIDGRAYPWGNAWGPYKANFSGQDKPEPVGSYPEGISPYGALDMAGNASEWVAGRFELYPDAEAFIPERVLHGWRTRGFLGPTPSIELRLLRGANTLIFYMTRVSARAGIYTETADALGGFRCAYSQ